MAGDEAASSSGTPLLLAYGLPIEDVAWATTVYERAVGQILRLFEEPHWV